ncbi:MAG: extracellular solute-binding protein [Pirellulales bacterium]
MSAARRCILILTLVIGLSTGCSRAASERVITIWHPMRPAESALLDAQIALFQAANPGVRIRSLYKETEELRSGFQSAGLAGVGPDLVYGPSDAVGPYHTMGLLRDMSPWFPMEEQAKFADAALVRLPDRDDPNRQALLLVGDRIGNHLALVCNRNFAPTAPTTTDEMLQIALKNTVDEDSDGRIDRYGLVWNFTEPFFAVPFLTGHGSWVFAGPDSTEPALDNPGTVAALEQIVELKSRHRVIPANCDYEMADSLFKSGKAAMIINGDWSWGDYLVNPAIDAYVVPLPVVSETGLPMQPMVATKGYSLSASISQEQADAAMEFVRFVTREEAQRTYMAELKTLPSRTALLEDPSVQQDPTLNASIRQMKNSRPMPVVAELRAVWDAMRPHYQALLGGSESAGNAAAAMQRDAVSKIQQMNQEVRPGLIARLFTPFVALLAVFMLIWQWPNLSRFRHDWPRNKLAYLFVAPALLLILLTVVFPFGYNIVLSMSNMSLRHFRDWQVTGLQNYVDVFREATFVPVLIKTLVWTIVNVTFHVTLGLILAVALNGPIRGKSIYRILLIIPWAVPAYITALTWRGMFDFEYGAVNLLISKYLSMPMINWLGSPWEAFLACIITNVWLGFPFMMVIALGGMQGIPQDLYEAARIDGVSRIGQFFHITLPLLKPVLAPAITLGAIWTFNNLNVIWLVSNGGEPSDQTHILVSYVYKAAFNLYRYGYGAALSMVIFAILLIFSLVFLKKSRAAENVY